MKFALLMLLLSFAGLTSLSVSVMLWRRHAGGSLRWLWSRGGWSVACLMVGGAGAIAGTHYRLAKWTPLESEFGGYHSALSARFITGAAVCIGLMLIGAIARGLNGPREPGRRLTPLLGGCAALAAIISLVELIAVQRQLVIPGIQRVALDTPNTPFTERYQKPYQFKTESGYDWVSRAVPAWKVALAPLVGKPGLHYLEIGLYEGRSFFWMAENILTHPTAKLTGVDPFFDEHYEDSGDKTYRDVFYANLAASGIQNKARIIEGFSQIALRSLPLESFDIIYVDGSHNSRDVLEDAVLGWRLLKDGGFLILDDYLMAPGMKRTIDTFAAIFQDDFQVIHAEWQVILKKNHLDRSAPGPWR